MDDKLFAEVYEAVVKREATYEGVYYTGVRTTKIVCRPTCRARTPKASNVTFFPTLQEAVREGFRPCKRCRPEAGGKLRPDAALAVQVDKLIEQRYADKLTLQLLAEETAVSPFHLQRVYKQVNGYSPAEKLERTRLVHAKRLLEQTDGTVATIGAAVGYGSPSHFTAWFCRRAGCSPTEYRDQHKGGSADERN